MRRREIARLSLRAAGALLVLLGLVHLVATPHIAALLNGAPPRVRQLALGPTLLNHVLVGVLLVPLGFTTWLAASKNELGVAWTKPTLLVNSLAVLTMPALVLIFMHQPRYFTAPLFVAGVALATAAAVVVAVASWIVGSAGSRDP